MEYIQTTTEENIIIATLNRPDKLNALNRTVIGELGLIIDQVRGDSEIRGLIITGAGENAFAAGADINEFQDYPPAEAKLMAQKGHEVFERIETSPKPVIAAINGFCLGGGLELAMSAHIRLCSRNAKFGQPEVTLGIIPGYGGTQRLPHLVGRGNAYELLLTGDMIDAERALNIGLVNQIFSLESLLDEAKAMMSKISKKAPLAIASVIEAVNTKNESFKAGFDKEIEEFSQLFETDDFTEGVSAFLDKRPPNFKGK